MLSDPIPIQYRPYTVQFFPSETNRSSNKYGQLFFLRTKESKTEILGTKNTQTAPLQERDLHDDVPRSLTTPSVEETDRM